MNVGAHLLDINANPLWPQKERIVVVPQGRPLGTGHAHPGGDHLDTYARKSFIDHTFYDTTSILGFIETHWGIYPLGARDAAASDLTNTLAILAPTVKGCITGLGLQSTLNYNR